MNNSEKYFEEGYCCAEAILLSVCNYYGIISELVPKIATGFCTGIAKTDSLCGALAGGILAINVKTGRSNPDEDRTINYELIQELTSFFEREFGSLTCTGVAGFNLSTLEGKELYENNNRKVHCTHVVGKTTDFVLEIIEE